MHMLYCKAPPFFVFHSTDSRGTTIYYRTRFKFINKMVKYVFNNLKVIRGCPGKRGISNGSRTASCS